MSKAALSLYDVLSNEPPLIMQIFHLLTFVEKKTSSTFLRSSIFWDLIAKRRGKENIWDLQKYAAFLGVGSVIGTLIKFRVTQNGGGII